MSGNEINQMRGGNYVDIVGVTGSIPVAPTIFSMTYGAFPYRPADGVKITAQR